MLVRHSRTKDNHMIERISSFTNEVGTRQRFVNRRGYYRGTYYNTDLSGELNCNYMSLAEVSGKPAPFKEHGPRSNFNYARYVQKIMYDRVGKIEHYSADPNPYTGVPPLYNYTEDYFVTQNYAPLSFVPSAPGERDNALDASVVKALNHLASQKAAIGESLATARQTINMLSSSVQRLARVLLALKSGRPQMIPQILGLGKHGGGNSHTLADYWLQYSYGWKPLMSDIHDLQALVHRDLSNAIYVAGRATVPYNASGHMYWGPFWDNPWTVEGSVRTVVIGKIESKALYLLNSASLINPLTILWEVLPWSFAIDWFVPIGQTLEAATAAVGLIEMGGYHSEIKGGTLKMKRLPDPVGSNLYGWHRCTVGPELLQKEFSFARTAFVNWPKTRLFVDDTPYSTPRALNALALVRQLT